MQTITTSLSVCSAPRRTVSPAIARRGCAHTAVLFTVLAGSLLAGCPGSRDNLTFDVTYTDAPNGMGQPFCSLPLPDIQGARVPASFCVRQFARVGSARVMAFAPNGDLFVSSPASSAPGGSGGGSAAIVLLTDADRDGVADAPVMFATQVHDVHGLAVTSDAVWFTTDAAVWKTPWRAGQRTETPGARTMIAAFPPLPSGRWTHGLTVDSAGTVYVSQGVYTSSTCPDTPRAGRIYRVDGTNMLTAMGDELRNPMYLGCHPTKPFCLASELGDDGGAGYGARERLIRLRESTHWGFPCCSTVGSANPAFSGSYDCASLPREERSLPLFSTPFGMDWERGRWPLPFQNGFFVALHGSFYSVPVWEGASVVFAPTDATTGLPTGEFRSVLLGFGPGGSPLDRPSDVKFAPDGRLFVADDLGNNIYWMAPAGLRGEN